MRKTIALGAGGVVALALIGGGVADAATSSAGTTGSQATQYRPQGR